MGVSSLRLEPRYGGVFLVVPIPSVRDEEQDNQSLAGRA
jgi:hypothetical protein